MHTNQHMLQHMLMTVARRLGDLREQVVFVGGATVPLLLSDPSAPPVRSTNDVDVIVEIATRAAYYRLSELLRERGFKEDVDASILCRWKVDDLLVDVMPTDPAILGFSNRWYGQAITAAVRHDLDADDPQTSIRLVTPPFFLATKCEAFLGRGKGDFLGSRDIEDIVAVLDGRPELAGEVQASSPELRAYLAAQFAQWLQNPDFEDALPGHLPGDSASQARLPLLLHRLRRIAAL